MSKAEDELRGNVKMALENCACAGRDAYGAYIDKMIDFIMKSVLKAQQATESERSKS